LAGIASFAQFVKDDRGQDLIEYALLLGFINHAHAAFKNFADHVVAEIAFDREKRHGADGGKTFGEVKSGTR